MSDEDDLPATEPTHDPDAISDPAKDDTEGQDWTAEGGATPGGPATDVGADLDPDTEEPGTSQRP